MVLPKSLFRGRVDTGSQSVKQSFKKFPVIFAVLRESGPVLFFTGDGVHAVSDAGMASQTAGGFRDSPKAVRCVASSGGWRFR
jgi:hypothetical protein